MTPPADNLPWKRNLVAMWLSQLLVMSGFCAAIPFIPLFLRDQFGLVSESERGVYMSMFYFFGVAGYALFSPVWGVLADRFGVKPMLLRGTFVTAFIFPLMGLVSQPWMLIALRFLSAACAGTTAASQTLLVKTTPEDRQGFALGVLSTAIWGGAMLGNVIGGIVVYYCGYQYTFNVCGIMYFLAGIIVLFCRDVKRPQTDPLPATPKAREYRRYRRSPIPGFTLGVWMMLLLFLLLGFVRNFESPFMALMVEHIDGPEKATYWTGIISAFVSVGALLSGMVLGYLSDFVKPYFLLVPACAVSAAMLVLQGCTDSLLTFGICRTLMYFAAGALPTVLQKTLSGATPLRKRGSVFGFAVTAQNCGTMLASLFAGWTIFCWGTPGVFYTAAVLSLMLIPVAVWAIRRTMNQPYFVAHAALGIRACRK